MKDAEFRRLLEAPAPLVLCASRKKAIWLVLAAALVVALGLVLVIKTGGLAMLLGALLIILFGVVFTAAAWLVATPEIYSLTLSGKGFRVKTPWHVESRLWSGVSQFIAKPVAATSLVRLQSKQIFFDDGATGKLAAINRSLSGYSGALVSTYNLDADQLEYLMNHWRQRALTRG